MKSLLNKQGGVKMDDLIVKKENAEKVANIVEKLDIDEQQRAIDIVTSFALGVQSAKIQSKEIHKSD